MSLMIPPSLLLMLVISVLYGALFYLWKGKTWSDLLLFMLVAMIGLLLGQLIAYLLGLDVARLGRVHIIEGTIFAWLLMLAIAWLKG